MVAVRQQQPNSLITDIDYNARAQRKNYFKTPSPAMNIIPETAVLSLLTRYTATKYCRIPELYFDRLATTSSSTMPRRRFSTGQQVEAMSDYRTIRIALRSQWPAEHTSQAGVNAVNNYNDVPMPVEPATQLPCK
jgi:hypothetical protein